MDRDAVVVFAPRTGAPAACGLAIAYANAVLPRLSAHYDWGRDERSVATIAFALGDAAVARTPLPRTVSWGLGLAATVGGLMAVRPVRREPPESILKWVLVDIPLGTALPEEILFRGSLTPGLRAATGPRLGALLGALSFGLWHVGSARAGGQPVFPTIAVTSVTGATFDLITRRTRRVWPVITLHWALNSGGAILSSGSVFSSLGARDT